jgi:hypothetical protein
MRRKRLSRKLSTVSMMSDDESIGVERVDDFDRRGCRRCRTFPTKTSLRMSKVTMKSVVGAKVEVEEE